MGELAALAPEPRSAEVTALVPTSEVRRYAVDLRSLTGGRGRFHLEPAGYEPLPDHLVERARRELEDVDA